MRKFWFFLTFMFAIFSCQKEKDDLTDFKAIAFDDLRIKSHGLLTLVDITRQIVEYEDEGGGVDTLGESELFFRGDLISHRNWETTYMSPIHYKTDVLYSYHEGIMIIMIKPDYVFCDRIYILSDSFKKEFYVNVGEIKSAQIDVARRILRITYNNSGITTGPIPDKTEDFYY